MSSMRSRLSDAREKDTHVLFLGRLDTGSNEGRKAQRLRGRVQTPTSRAYGDREGALCRRQPGGIV